MGSLLPLSASSGGVAAGTRKTLRVSAISGGGRAEAPLS